eukprot:2308049-Prymnesium_polylepis.1
MVKGWSRDGQEFVGKRALTRDWSARLVDLKAVSNRRRIRWSDVFVGQGQVGEHRAQADELADVGR